MNQVINFPGGQSPQARNLSQMIANLGPQSQLATQSKVDPNALAAGIRPSFASVTFKGKTWGIRYRGNTHQLLARDPNTGQVLGAIPTIDVIVIKSATAISKSFYMEKYKEGDFNQPDCWSTNGQVPDPAAPKKQSATCRGCRWDAFGSRTMDDGRKGKACSDNKRVAVVPAGDIKNEIYGGPMLLKLPPSAFNGLSELQAQLLQQGYNYYAVVMRLSFDFNAAFPKIEFTPIRTLNDHEMTEVLALQDDPTVERILSEELFEVSADPNQPAPEAQQARQPETYTGLSPAAAAQVYTPPQANTPPTHYPHAHPQGFAPPPTTAFSPGVPPQHQPAAPVHHVAPSAAFAGGFAAQPTPTPPPQANADGMDIPPHLRGPSQAPQAAVQQPSQQAVPQTPGQPPCPPGVDPAMWQAFLASQQGQATKPKRQNKRSNPVTPTGPQPSGQPAPVDMKALQQSLPGETIVPVDDGEGDAPPDLDNRIDSLLGGATGS